MLCGCSSRRRRWRRSTTTSWPRCCAAWTARAGRPQRSRPSPASAWLQRCGCGWRCTTGRRCGSNVYHGGLLEGHVCLNWHSCWMPPFPVHVLTYCHTPGLLDAQLNPGTINLLSSLVFRLLIQTNECDITNLHRLYVRLGRRQWSVWRPYCRATHSAHPAPSSPTQSLLLHLAACQGAARPTPLRSWGLRARLQVRNMVGVL